MLTICNNNCSRNNLTVLSTCCLNTNVDYLDGEVFISARFRELYTNIDSPNVHKKRFVSLVSFKGPSMINCARKWHGTLKNKYTNDILVSVRYWWTFGEIYLCAFCDHSSLGVINDLGHDLRGEVGKAYSVFYSHKPYIGSKSKLTNCRRGVGRRDIWSPNGILILSQSESNRVHYRPST